MREHDTMPYCWGHEVELMRSTSPPPPYKGGEQDYACVV